MTAVAPVYAAVVASGTHGMSAHRLGGSVTSTDSGGS